MKILFYDVFCGISGDMNMGALVDLGVDFDHLKQELAKLKIDEEFRLIKHRGIKHGITGTKVDVVLLNQDQDHHHDHEHDHHHDHDDSHHNHDHSHHDHDHGHGNHNHHRNFAMIREMIVSSDLSPRVKELSVEMFRLVAEAEGKVHGKPLEEVHFHEVGATDSIVDIVGAAICLEALQVDRVMATKVQVGGGFVQCAHGRMPVPAPATAEILKDVPLAYNVVPFETTTPTGAAILKATVNGFDEGQNFEVQKIGYGLGFKDFEVPNVLRVYLAEDNRSKDLEVEEQYIMSCNIDDMNPEIFTYVEDKLFSAGALDVYKTPIMMKKGRPAIKLSVLFSEKDREVLQRVLFRETSTAGVRETAVTKYMLPREMARVETKYGPVRVKHLMMDGALLKSKGEYEDCRALAEKHDISIHEIYKEVQHQLNQGDKE